MTKLDRAVVRWFPEVNGLYAKRDFVVTMRPPDLIEIRVKGARGGRGTRALSLSRLWEFTIGLLTGSATVDDLVPQKPPAAGKVPKKARTIAPAKKRRPTIVGKARPKRQVSAGSKKRPPKKGKRKTAVGIHKRKKATDRRWLKRKTVNRSRSRKGGRR
jgi:hypothetical protein